MSESISEYDNCTGLCDGLFLHGHFSSNLRCHFSTLRAVISAVTCALLLQHLARSTIGVAHDDRAALFAVD